MLREMLEEEGYEVEVQVEGQAVQQMAGPFPDLLFLALRHGWAHDLPTAREPGSNAPPSDHPPRRPSRYARPG